MKKFARHDLNGANLRACENFSVAITNDCPAPMRKAPGGAMELPGTVRIWYVA